MDQDTVLFVLAKNDDEFKRWVRHNVRRVTSKEQVMGITNFEVVEIGKCRQSIDSDLLAELQTKTVKSYFPK